MAETLDVAGLGLVGMARDSVLALRSAMFRDLGASAAALLQEAGYAGGASMYAAFGAWLAAQQQIAPEELPAREFSARASAFFGAAGWGSVTVEALGPAVACLDSENWAEADPAYPLDFPACYYSSGVLADFFGRVAGAPLSVMEVECRSAGSSRCRFLVATAEVIQQVYDQMANGGTYEEISQQIGAPPPPPA